MKYFEATLYVSAHNDQVSQICQTNGFGWNGHYWQVRSKEQGFLRQLVNDTRNFLGAYGYTVYRARLLGVISDDTYKDPA